MQFFQKYKNYVVTFGIEFLILLLGFVIFRIANEQMTALGFSEYTLSRRNISFLQPLLMIGLGVAVPRYISIYPQRNSFLPASLFLMLSVSFLFLIVLSVWSIEFSTLFFGDAKYQSYILPMGLLLIGYGFHAIVYGFLRGKQEVYFSNLIQLLNIGILPVVVLLFIQDVKLLLYVNSLFLLINCFIFIFIVFRKMKIRIDIPACKEDSILMLRYGLPRVLGDFALLALLTFPTYIVLSQEKDILIGGDVAYSITLFNLVGAAFGPLSLVLLPEIASFLAEKRIDLIKKRFYIFVIGSLGLTLIGYLIFFFFNDFVLTILLGSNYRLGIVDVSVVLLLGSFGYVLYIVLRSFLDAIHVKAKNATNLIISLAVYLLLVWYGLKHTVSINTYLYYFVFAVNLLGLLTFVKTYFTLKKLK